MQLTTRAFKTHWRWIALLVIACAPRLCLLHSYDVELSQDGFEAVRTLTIWQTQGIAALPRELLDRALLHPLYMLLLGALRIITPAAFDFYFAARLFSTLLACIAVIVLFEFTRRAFNDVAAWLAALLLAFAPSFLWESVAILSSTLFLALYVAVWRALVQVRYRLAALWALLAALTRYEGVALIALVFLALLVRDLHARKIHLADWFVCGVFVLAAPLTIVGSSWLATGNPLRFIGAQSMASIWLRFLAQGDFARRGAFFITQYPAIFPAPVVWLGIAGALVALIWLRGRGTVLLFGTSILFLLFFEALVWFDYTTLETRFLMYPGLPLLVFAGVALARVQSSVVSHQSSVNRPIAHPVSRFTFHILLVLLVAGLCAMSYQQGDAGMRFVYNMHASQREVAEELARLVPAHQRTNVMVYGGIAGALDFYARQRELDLALVFFRFAPDENPEQYVLDHQIQFVIYPVGNAFAQAKFPYLARFEPHTRGAVTFQPLTQFATSLDNQLYSVWRVTR